LPGTVAKWPWKQAEGPVRVQLLHAKRDGQVLFFFADDLTGVPLRDLRVAHAAQRRPDTFSEALEEVLARFPSPKMRISSPGWSLSGGEQQMLAIGRAIIACPSLMLLDEPSMGLAPKLVHDAFASLKRLNEAGATILRVEQNAYQALKVANRCFVLENGRVTHSGLAHQLRNHPDIVRAFLGA
jgi:branched-chain amino acid transport system ATP-binding protein